MSDANTVQVTAVGDLMLGDSAKCIGVGCRSIAARKGVRSLFSGVEELLAGDIVFGNLECVLSDRLYSRYSFTNGQMSASPSVAQALAGYGFNVLSVANNHTMQYGPDTFRETCEALRAHGIAVAGIRDGGGYTCRPVFITVRNLVVALLAYSLERDNYCRDTLYASGTTDEILTDLAQLRGRCDRLIVSMHWGNEFVTRRSQRQAELGRRLVEAGADLVLGHHPHVIQEVELHRGKPIVYSLGNFISDMVWDAPLRESLLAKFALQRDGVRGEIHHLKVDPALSSRSVRAFPLEQYLVHQGEGGEEDRHGSYERTVELLRVRQRNLSHLFLVKNFYRYHPWVLFQIMNRSLKSLLGLAGANAFSRER